MVLVCWIPEAWRHTRPSATHMLAFPPTLSHTQRQPHPPTAPQSPMPIYPPPPTPQLHISSVPPPPPPPHTHTHTVANIHLHSFKHQPTYINTLHTHTHTHAHPLAPPPPPHLFHHIHLVWGDPVLLTEYKSKYLCTDSVKFKLAKIVENPARLREQQHATMICQVWRSFVPSDWNRRLQEPPAATLRAFPVK